MMKIRFRTSSQFLRNSKRGVFAVRRALLGRWTTPVSLEYLDRVENTASLGVLTSPRQVRVPPDTIPVIHPIWRTEIANQVAEPNPLNLRTQQPTGKLASSFWRSRVTQGILTAILLISVMTLAVIFGPKAYYALVPPEVVPVIAQEEGTPLGGQFVRGSEATTITQPQPTPYQPPKEESLPEGNWLVIPRIGFRSELQKTEQAETALETGIWWTPGYGDPGSRDLPMIVAGHRYGWKWWWKDDYWKYHSFYLLPELEPGDLVEVIADQRKWVYEIYAGEEGEEITDYEADLILYTCKFLDSPIRHFRYARLVDPTQNTQAVKAQVEGGTPAAGESAGVKNLTLQ